MVKSVILDVESYNPTFLFIILRSLTVERTVVFFEIFDADGIGTLKAELSLKWDTSRGDGLRRLISSRTSSAMLLFNELMILFSSKITGEGTVLGFDFSDKTKTNFN